MHNTNVLSNMLGRRLRFISPKHGHFPPHMAGLEGKEALVMSVYTAVNSLWYTLCDDEGNIYDVAAHGLAGLCKMVMPADSIL